MLLNSVSKKVSVVGVPVVFGGSYRVEQSCLFFEMRICYQCQKPSSLLNFIVVFRNVAKGGEGENSYEIRLGNSALEILVGFLSHGFFVLVPVG